MTTSTTSPTYLVRKVAQNRFVPLRINDVPVLVVIYQDKNTVSQKMCHVAKRIQRMGFLS